MGEADWRDWEDIDFDIEKETWNVYELADGTILKVRCILAKLRRKPIAGKAGEYEFNASFQNIINALVNPREKGAPSRPLTPAEIDKLPKKIINFTIVKEDWNIYRLSDGSGVKIKLALSDIYKINGEYKNIFGEPIYVIKSTNVVSPIQKI